MSNHEYTMTISTQYPIPDDVLVEHLAVALRDLNYLGRYGIHMNNVKHPEEDMTRNHPFDGPEVFDDEPQLEKFTNGGYTGTHGEGSFTAYLPPHETVLTKAQVESMNTLRAMGDLVHRKDGTCHGGSCEVVASWSEPTDPYPNVTEAAMQLKEAKRDAGR